MPNFCRVLASTVPGNDFLKWVTTCTRAAGPVTYGCLSAMCFPLSAPESVRFLVLCIPDQGDHPFRRKAIADSGARQYAVMKNNLPDRWLSGSGKCSIADERLDRVLDLIELPDHLDRLRKGALFGVVQIKAKVALEVSLRRESSLPVGDDRVRD